MRRAFVIGSNGPKHLSPLHYACKDAEMMRACLSGPECGFVVEMPPPGADPWDVRRQISMVAGACTSDDSFVCYFSGHGILERGALFLLWDNTQLDQLLSSALPISDCCHAGSVVTMAGLKDGVGTPVKEMEIQPDNYLVLMASDRFEKARELDRLQGSFLSANICTALTERFAESDKDQDNRISIHDLMLWLEERARQHNREFPNQTVPYPYLFGQQKGDFFLTVGATDWVPAEFSWPDGSTMVVIPVRLRNSRALCIGKYPVTNAQYERFIKERKYEEPVGEYFQGHWRGPFRPWQEEDFRDPNKPVVCVSYGNARDYCKWVNAQPQPFRDATTKLPDAEQWDFSAFQTRFPTHDTRIWLACSKEIHHKASAPTVIDQTGTRSNVWGISDMIGNVWEWCWSAEREEASSRAVMQGMVSGSVMLPDGRSMMSSLRGGGFLDDLTNVEPFAWVAKDTRHSDLGFRIAVEIPLKCLPADLQSRLAPCRILNDGVVHGVGLSGAVAISGVMAHANITNIIISGVSPSEKRIRDRPE
jgi:formylglycine-generating enzyme required for sulfatase activity